MQPTASTEAQNPPVVPPSAGPGAKVDIGTLLGAVALVVALVALALNFVVPGPAGAAGASFTSSTTLKPGQSESGVFSAWGGNDQYFAAEVNFRIPLPAGLPDGNWTFIEVGGANTTACPGFGHAAAGELCLYEMGEGNRDLGEVFNPTYSDGPYNVSQWGFGVWFTSTSTGTSWSYGGWTVTAS